MDGRRDQMGSESVAEVPTQTACLNLAENYPVRKDWMVETVDIELAAHHAVIELVSKLRAGCGRDQRAHSNPATLVALIASRPVLNGFIIRNHRWPH